MHLELRIMEHFVGNPDACESVTGVSQLWLGGDPPLSVSSALQNLTNCGLLHRFGEGDRAVFYCVDVALVGAVLQMLKEKHKTQPIVESENTILKISVPWA